MNELLRQFDGDIHTKDALISFIHQFIAIEGVRRIYAKESVDAVADAKELIDKAFSQLSIDYGLTITAPAPINESR